MNAFVISGFINGVSAVVLGLIVYLKSPKKVENQAFGLMTFALAIWSLGYSFWQMTTDQQMALFWVRVLSIGSTFIPITFLYWIFSLFNLREEKKKILTAGYFITLFFISFIFSDLFIKGVAPQLSFPWWPQAGIIYTLYVVIGYLGIIGYGCYSLIKIYPERDPVTQVKIKYVLLAVMVGFGGGATNFPLWYGLKIPPYGNFLVFVYPFILAYIMLRYKLMDVKIILTQFLVAIIGLLLFIQFLISDTLFDYFWKGVLFLAFLFFGQLLIKSVNQEVKQKMEIERLYQEAKRLSRAKTEFLSITSHQLRTPLTAMKGYISMVLEGGYGNLTKKVEKPIKNVYQSNERLIRLVNNLLNLSRLEAGKIKVTLVPTSLEEIIEDVARELKITVKDKNLYIKIKSPKKKLPKVMVDQDHIRQVILNVIDNAIKYTKEGGVTVELLNEDDKILVKISDTGEGMDQEEMSQLFEMFSRSDAGNQFHIEGAGIGLYVAKKFIEMHKGRIYAESDGKGKGSTFHIELPISQL